MAIFHRATISMAEAELIAWWAPTTPWAPPPGPVVLTEVRER